MEGLIPMIIEEGFSKEKKWRTDNAKQAKDGNRFTL